MWLKKKNKMYNLDKVSVIEVVNGRLWLDGNCIADADEYLLPTLALCLKSDLPIHKVFVIE